MHRCTLAFTYTKPITHVRDKLILYVQGTKGLMWPSLGYPTTPLIVLGHITRISRPGVGLDGSDCRVGGGGWLRCADMTRMLLGSQDGKVVELWRLWVFWD